MDNDLLFSCPHCELLICVKRNEINCGIFRHGVYIKSGLQINPHLCQRECEDLYNSNSIYGCGKPFRVSINNNGGEVGVVLEKCDYI